MRLAVQHIVRRRHYGCNTLPNLAIDSVNRNLPIGYAVDLTPFVAAKEGGASWNARRMTEIPCKLESAVDFASRKEYGSMASGRTPGKIARHVEGQAGRRSTGIRRKSDEPVG
jgi:hypothetical protein